MFVTIRRQMSSQKGFTLVELLVVIAILGVLVTLAVPKFTSSTDDAKNTKLKADLRSADSALMMYYGSNGKYLADQDAFNAAIVNYMTKEPSDAKGNNFVYTSSNQQKYKLLGKDTANADVKSEGSSE